MPFPQTRVPSGANYRIIKPPENQVPDQGSIKRSCKALV